MSGTGGVISGIGSGLSAGLNYQLAQQQAQEASRLSSLQAELSQAGAAAAQSQVDLAWDQWNTYKQTLGPLEAAAARQAVSDMGLLAPLREAQVSEARRDIELYKPLKETSVATAVRSMQRFEPLEAQVVQDALAGVQADPTRAAGRAAVDVRDSFAKAREGEERKLSSMGLDPARMAWMGHSSSMQEAAAEAAARTRAAETEIQRAETATRQGRLDALGLRKQAAMPGQSSLNAAPVDTFGDPAGQAASLMRAGQAGLTGLAGDSMAMSQNAQKLYGQYSQQFLKDFGLMFSKLSR
ncbi:hypothetical protein PCS_00044 [Desulfocurvibacter africanus PCS]|uniref:Uncharacterized protein n=1 Tax=Desulfocurvibacter africanus PCS TaxID=1262666 RepID=M5Q3W5_DESAF|nr:hypothetical protein [Desulfocurvibacter africanus]EMG39158.1 hypothetical protein PCS_00044 [Desulfocurvibacter africanus PCS]